MIKKAVGAAENKTESRLVGNEMSFKRPRVAVFNQNQFAAAPPPECEQVGQLRPGNGKVHTDKLCGNAVRYCPRRAHNLAPMSQVAL